MLCIQTQCKNFCSRVYNKIHFVCAFLYVNIEKSLLFEIDTTTDTFVCVKCKMNLEKVHPVCACPDDRQAKSVQICTTDTLFFCDFLTIKNMCLQQTDTDKKKSTVDKNRQK